MEVRVEAGNSMHFAHMQVMRVGDGFHLLLRKITVLPLNGFQVLENSFGVVDFRTDFYE